MCKVVTQGIPPQAASVGSGANAVHVMCSGSYFSAVPVITSPVPKPPTTITDPSGIKVAVWLLRAVIIGVVGRNSCVSG